MAGLTDCRKDLSQHGSLFWEASDYSLPETASLHFCQVPLLLSAVLCKSLTCVPEAYMSVPEEMTDHLKTTLLSPVGPSYPSHFQDSLPLQFVSRSSVSFIGSITKVYKHYFFSVLKKINPCNSYPLIIINNTAPSSLFIVKLVQVCWAHTDSSFHSLSNLLPSSFNSHFLQRK